MGVDRVRGHGEDSAVELGEVVHPVGEGGEALRVDKVHGVEHQADILLTWKQQTELIKAPVTRI